MVQFSVYSKLKDVSMDILENRRINKALMIENGLQSSSSSSLQESLDVLSKSSLQFVSGATSGMVATVLTYPFDITRTQFVVQGRHKVYSTILSFAKMKLRERGVRGFFVGMTPAVMSITPYMGFNFAFYEAFKDVIHVPLQSLPLAHYDNQWIEELRKIVSHGLCGALAGGLSKLVVYPLVRR